LIIACGGDGKIAASMWNLGYYRPEREATFGAR
jgi:hypothetical protein